MPAGDYTLLKLGSQRVGAMYQMTEDRKIAGVLPHWNSYVAVTQRRRNGQEYNRSRREGVAGTFRRGRESHGKPSGSYRREVLHLGNQRATASDSPQ